MNAAHQGVGPVGFGGDDVTIAQAGGGSDARLVVVGVRPGEIDIGGVAIGIMGRAGLAILAVVGVV